MPKTVDTRRHCEEDWEHAATQSLHLSFCSQSSAQCLLVSTVFGTVPSLHSIYFIFNDFYTCIITNEPYQKLLKQEGIERRNESMQQCSALPSLHLYRWGLLLWHCVIFLYSYLVLFTLARVMDVNACPLIDRVTRPVPRRTTKTASFVLLMAG